MTNREMWEYETFAWLLVSDPKQAFEYRKRVLWDEIPEEYRDDIQVTVEEYIENKQDNVEVTRESVIKKLKSSDIKFSYNSNTEKLIEKAIENNLI